MHALLASAALLGLWASSALWAPALGVPGGLHDTLDVFLLFLGGAMAGIGVTFWAMNVTEKPPW